MASRLFLMLMTFAATMAFSARASAEPALFNAPVVSDQQLSSVSGTAAPYAMLTRGSLHRLAENQSRSDFLSTGSISRIQMDAWWGTIGSELIANSVRNGL